MSAISKRISELMQQKKISALDVERSTGLSRNTIYSIINGNSKKPTAHNLQLIATALGISLESILLDEKESFIGKLNVEQLKTLETITTHVINLVIQRNLCLSFDSLTALIKEIFQYSIKTTPPSVEQRFIEWVIERQFGK